MIDKKRVPLKPILKPIPDKKEISTSDGSSADYYKLPLRAKQLQQLISHKDMNAQVGEIFRACYRYGECSHSDKARDMRKIIFYAKAELKRLDDLILLIDL